MKDIAETNLMRRHPGNPVLSAKDIPYPAGLIFNAGVCRFQGRYVMVFRNDYGWTERDFDDHYAGRRPDLPQVRTNLGLAFSADGIRWEVEPKPCFELSDAEIQRVYDPRLTVLDGRVYMCFAVDTLHGVRGGIAVTDDFRKFDVLSMTVPDNRNMVLFPRKIGGRYVRLERPFPVYSRGKDRFDLWLGRSPDLRYWGDFDLVLGVEDVPFACDKIGPGAPPVWTPRGWLATFHGVDRDDAHKMKNGWEASWTKRYYAGIMLLDLEDPSRVIGMSKVPLLSPTAPYERSGGFRNDVIFPGGMILEEGGEVKVYYGAADTVECLATAHVDDLIGLCTAPRR